MRLGKNMGFHLDRVIRSLGTIVVCALLIACANADMEQLNSNRFMGFFEEDSFLIDWITKNMRTIDPFDPVWGGWGRQADEVEKELLPILDDLEFYALYVESNVDNGIWDVFLIGHDGTDWIQSCWERGQKIVLEKPALKDNWNKRLCNFLFSDDIVMHTGNTMVMVIDATTVYLFITCHDGFKRFAAYNPPSGVYGTSNDRYIRQIQRMIRYFKRNHLWFRLNKKWRT